MLKANGLWYYRIANQARQSGGLEADIWAHGARPGVVTHAPGLTRALTTRTFLEHMAEVVTPLLLAAKLTNRTAALPRLPCKGLSWRVPPWTPRTERLPPNGGHYFPSCRTGACSFHVIATGAASVSELTRARATASALNFSTPFSSALGAFAETIGTAELSCVPMEGAQHDFRTDAFVSGHVKASVMHAPVLDAYLQLVAESGQGPTSARVHIDGADRAANARRPRQQPTVRMMWGAFVDAVMAAERSSTLPTMLLYLPGKLRIQGVPAEVEKACDGCVTRLESDAFGDVAAYGTAGYCAETGPSDEGADCTSADKGMVPMVLEDSGGGSARFVVNGPLACLRHLATRCPRARVATVSVSERDCSWYTACDLTNGLKQSGLGHQSFDLTQPAVRRALGLRGRARERGV